MNRRELELMISGLHYHIARCKEDGHGYSSRIWDSIDELQDSIAEFDTVRGNLSTKLDDIMGVGELPYGLTIIKP